MPENVYACPASGVASCEFSVLQTLRQVMTGDYQIAAPMPPQDVLSGPGKQLAFVGPVSRTRQG